MGEIKSLIELKNPVELSQQDFFCTNSNITLE